MLRKGAEVMGPRSDFDLLRILSRLPLPALRISSNTAAGVCNERLPQPSFSVMRQDPQQIEVAPRPHFTSAPCAAFEFRPEVFVTVPSFSYAEAAGKTMSAT